MKKHKVAKAQGFNGIQGRARGSTKEKFYSSPFAQKQKVKKQEEALKEQKEKTPSEIIKMENDKALRSKEKILQHLYIHIPKAAGYYIFNKLRVLMSRGGIFDGLGGRTNHTGWAYHPCNAGLAKLWDFKTEKYPTEVDGVPCNFWMTEDLVERSAGHHHAYTLIRSPIQHVVSQYFHCKESSNHADRAYLMPSLDKWLDHHVQRFEDAGDVVRVKKETPDPFQCYDPINLESRHVNFNPDKDLKHLMQSFTVVGVLDQVNKFVCALHIRYTGVVPLVCDCTDGAKGRRLQDHGVEHHGASFKLTSSQLSKISKITALDSVLYSEAKLAFVEQVLGIERDFGVKLCDNPTIE